MKTKKRNKNVTIKKINKRKIKPEIVNYIFELAKEKCNGEQMTNKEIVNKIYSQFGIVIGVTTVIRYMSKSINKIINEKVKIKKRRRHNKEFCRIREIRE